MYDDCGRADGSLAVRVFINWFGEKQGNGVEYHILAIGMALSLIVSGGGMLSLDRAILRLIAG
jgi:uncharacterized membrane protein YphA (DoxX/SURF4 family)